MANVSGTIVTYGTFNEFISTGVISPYSFPFSVPGALGDPATTLVYTNGTGALQIDLVYAAKITLASTTQTIDLTSFTDPAGVAGNMARVRELLLYNPDTVAGHDVTLYKGASNGWSMLPASTNPLQARANGGFVRISDPNSTGASNGNFTGGSSKNVTVDSGAHTVAFYLLILGSSVA